jgi:ABC-type lipoprotein export system ATPase subunit
MLETTELSFHYPAGPSFRFAPMTCQSGQTLLISGASGVGKTTLLHLLGGLIVPHKGQISINRVSLTTLPERERDRFRGAHIGIVFQKMHFISSLHLLDNLLLASWLGRGKKEEQKAKKLLSSLGLEGKERDRIATLSQGQLQRVAIARALMNEPTLLLADEPTSGLDDENTEKVIELLITSAKDYNAALIVVTHDKRIAPAFDQKIVLT